MIPAPPPRRNRWAAAVPGRPAAPRRPAGPAPEPPARTLLPVTPGGPPRPDGPPPTASGAAPAGADTLSGVNAVGPVLLLVLGALLGATTQVSQDAEMVLRVPSLFAALFMVAQGLYELDRMHRTRLADRATEAVDPASPGRASHAAQQPAQAGPSAQARMAIPVVLMVLSAWLGLAVLRGAGGADVPLAVLATLSAFLLFAIGWQVLLGAR